MKPTARVERIFRRLVNFLRPRPVSVPLTVDQVLSSGSARDLVEGFINLYYKGGVARSLNYRGIEILKNPCDLWVITELIQSLKPRWIIETGTHVGGSATYCADMLKLFGVEGRVVTIDMNPKWSEDPALRGIVSIKGYSTDRSVVDRVASLVGEAGKGPVLVLLDSDHSKENVLSELRLYSTFVTVGSYVVVEDTLVNGHPSFPEHGPGPWEAVQDFLTETDAFEVDLSCQRHLLTYCPGGWLKRVK